MNLTYVVPFWPYAYTPWLFREVAWMRSRGHHVALISIGDLPGPAADLKPYGLEDLPVLQIRKQYVADGQVLGSLLKLGTGGLLTGAGAGLKEFRKRDGVRQGVLEWSSMKRIFAFLKKHKTEVIDSHWAAHSSILSGEIKKETQIPFAVRFHGGDLYRNPSPNLDQIVEAADVLCPVSQFLKNLLLGERPVDWLPQVPKVEFDHSKIRICHNAIPEEAVGKEPVIQSDDQIVIGMVGRLDPEKRHCDLIQAVGMIANDFPQARVKIIGGGALEPDIRAEAQKQGIADRLEITGAVPWLQVIDEVRTLHIYAHGAEVEGCSLAILEGQGQGLPMLLSRTGAAEQCVMPGVNGYLFDSGNVQSQADGLRQLIEAGTEARQKMGQASLDHIRKHFLFDDLMQRLESILDAIRTGQTIPA